MIELAGGEDVLGTPGEPSRTVSWEELAASAPQIVVAMPVAMTPRGRTPRRSPTSDRLTALGAERVVAVDVSAYFSRPGPRLVDGLELLAHILHPESVPQAPGEAIAVELARA